MKNADCPAYVTQLERPHIGLVYDFIYLGWALSLKQKRRYTRAVLINQQDNPTVVLASTEYLKRKNLGKSFWHIEYILHKMYEQTRTIIAQDKKEWMNCGLQ